MMEIDIVKLTEEECVESGLNLISRKEYALPGSINSSICTFSLNESWTRQDRGIMSYTYGENLSDQKFDLRFCLSGGRYCQNDNCKECTLRQPGVCDESIDTMSIITFCFTPNYLQQFVPNQKLKDKKDHILSFVYPHSFSKYFPLCSRQRNALSELLADTYEGALENIFVNAKIHEVLLYSLDCLVEEQDKEVFTCRFLADDNGMSKIQMARNILLENLDSPITIKDLSRRVAINECYLKKGFKEVFGTTIFDFYQQQRMDHAKYLLYQQGLNVTDVAALLGYSSISHFSAAFKKQTGLKPCELLLR